MLDSSGKILPSGILEGTLTDLGRYDECIDVNQHQEGHTREYFGQPIRGQYCSITLEPPLPPRPRFHTICNRIPELSKISENGKVNLEKWPEFTNKIHIHIRTSSRSDYY